MSQIDYSLSTSEINAMLDDIPFFMGCYPSNKIPDTAERPALFVVNTDPAPSPFLAASETRGEHWVAIVLKDDATGIFLDPLGFPPLITDIQQYMNKACRNGFKFSNKTIQNANGKGCGFYCIAFLKFWAAGGTLKRFLSFFNNHSSNGSDANDLLVLRLLGHDVQ